MVAANALMGAPEPCSDAAEHPLALGTALALGQGWVSSAVVTHPSRVTTKCLWAQQAGPAGLIAPWLLE